MSLKSFFLLAMLICVLAPGCTSTDEPTAAPTEVVMIWQLATVGPTATLSEPDRLATQQSVPPTSAAPAIGPTPTPTPFIGMFLGESPVDPLAQDAGLPVEVAAPTRVIQQPTPLVCNIPPGEMFGTIWASEGNLRSEMGCPLQATFGFTGMVQVFEGGVMYQNVERNEVWAIAPGEFGDAGDYWFLADLQPVTPSIIPPEGRRVPQNQFGAMWATVAEAREDLEFALQEEQTIDVNIQRYEGGTLLLDVTVGIVFVLTVDGTAYGPFSI